MKHEARFGLVLGGGGVRCLSHLGMAEELLAAGLAPDLIASSSTGSLIGLLLAAGIPPSRVREALFRREQRLAWLKPSWQRGGLASPAAILRLLDRFALPENLEDLPIPLHIVVTDLEEGRQLVLSSGPCREAVLASAALPGIYPPVMIRGHLCGDGGIINNVPADVCRELVGPRGVVLTSSLEMNHVMPEALLRHVPQVVYRSIYLPLLNQRLRNQTLHSDLVLQPFSDHPLCFSRWREIVRFYSLGAMADLHERGRHHMGRALPELQALLARAAAEAEVEAAARRVEESAS
ncbi:MAG: patatin-like phospholipase family protein [Candidatus Delongbacteria bacterium]